MNVNLDENLNEGMRGNSTDAFFALLRAGLWEKDVQLLPYGKIDFSAIYKLAEEQSVVGLVAAGLEHVVDTKVPKEEALTFVGNTLQLEQRNTAMNKFVGALIDKMRHADIYSLLVKGQAVAQCYEKPLWRACGDVDIFLSDENYRKAKELLLPLASSSEPEGLREKQLPLTIEGWVVELHGHLYGGLSHGIDKELNAIKIDSFNNGSIRSCKIGHTQIFLLSVENDIFYIFSHILQHFFKGGIGVRQICDWCRLLWTYKDSLDIKKLETRIRNAGLNTEWKAFGAFAVKSLGMPAEAIPFYSADKRWEKKASKICDFIIMSGNFGHNRDMSYYNKYSYVVRKTLSLGRRTKDAIHHIGIFPLDSMRFFPNLVFNGLRCAFNRE